MNVTVLEVSGFKLLAEFRRTHKLSLAEFHRSMVNRYGSATPKYATVHSWFAEERRPGLTARAQLQESCGIPAVSWLTESEIAAETWRTDMARAPAHAL